MNHIIRNYISSDYSEIASWWEKSGHVAPIKGFMSPEVTYVLELDNIPALSLSMLLTNSKEAAYMEAFIKNPKFNNLHEYGFLLWDHCFKEAKKAGYKRVICASNIPKLFSKYEDFGMKKVSENYTGFVREL